MKKIYHELVAYSVILTAGFILYYQSLFFDLTYLDDNVWLKDYRWYLSDHRNLFQVFRKPDVLFGGLFYRPLIYFTFILDTQIKSNSFLIYHLTNIILHCLNGCLVYEIFKQLKYGRHIAFGCALIFTVHPVLTQAVVWIPGRTDSLMAACVFLSFITFLYFLERRRIVFALGHILFFGLALLTKETAVALPLVCFSYLLLCAGGKLRRRDYLLFLTVWGIILGAYLILRRAILVEKSDLSLELVFDSLWNNCPAIIGYIGKIFFPVNLSVLPILKDINLTYGWICLIVLCVMIILPGKKNYKRMMFAVGWFLMFLLPSFVGSFLKHEYRIYVPLVGMMIFVLELNVIQPAFGKYRRSTSVAFLMIAALLFGISWTYSRHYRSHFPFWENAVGTSPHSPLAHRNLGAMYFLDKKYDHAEAEFLGALELNPKEVMVYNNLGLIYEIRGDLIKAEQAYLSEVANNPDYDNAYYNLGLFYGKQHKYEKAAHMWSTAATINPRNLMAHKYLAVYFTKTGQKDRSEFHLNELRRRGVAIPSKIDQLIK